MRIIPALLTLAVAVTLAACGGGGDGNSSANGCTPTMLNPDACVPKLVLTLTNPAGAATAQVSPDAQGTFQADVRDASGAGVPNVVVTFVTTDTTAVLVPSTGTVLTDSTGVARVGLPAGTKAGAFTARATVNTGGTTIGGSLNYSVGFPAVTLSPLTTLPATLSAGGNASLSITVLRGGAAYTAPIPVAFTSPCVTAGKATIGSPVLTQAGVAVASYSDKGCGVADVITASVTVGESTVTKSGTITVLPAAAGSIKFNLADTTNIALKGTGGAGRQEFSTLTFQVYDETGTAVSGVAVDFVFSDTGTALTVGGLTLTPASATSNAKGEVTTLVKAGTVPTSVRVVATIRGKPISTLSNVLVVSTGVPDQRHFSLSTRTGNCEGRNVDQLCSIVTAQLGDHFGNPVPDGTAVNFTTEGGIIGASCLTGAAKVTPAGDTTASAILAPPIAGVCSVELRSGSPRPADSRVTVLAYALGEEEFTDINGNNVYDAAEPFGDRPPGVYRDDDESVSRSGGEPCIRPNPLDPTPSACEASAADGKYNGVLNTSRDSTSSPTPSIFVSRQLVQIFSAGGAFVSFSPASLTCPAGATRDVVVTVVDVDEPRNVMPAGTTITYTLAFVTGNPIVVPTSSTVPNVVLPVTSPRSPVPDAAIKFPLAISCPTDGSSGRLAVSVKSPLGVTTTTTMLIN